MARTDRIWLVRVLIIGCLCLMMVNLAVLALQYWNHRDRMEPSAKVAKEGKGVEETSEGSSIAGEPETSIHFRYPIFHGKWQIPSIRNIPREI